MILQKKYVFGGLVQFYEIEMLEEHIDSCIQMLDGVDNPENVAFHYCFNKQEYLEKIDPEVHGNSANLSMSRFLDQLDRLAALGCRINHYIVRNDLPFHNIARFRRDLNYNNCERCDYVCWSETDSLWPKQTLNILEALSEKVEMTHPKHYITFAYRKNWDSSWDRLTHPMFASIKFVDTEEFSLHNEASEKSYMSLDRMNQINDIPVDNVEILAFTEPKADGSCLVISSDLIKSGVNIPHGIIHNAEDISFCEQAKLIMGNDFVQFHVSNILRVHNRRHPRKRIGILNEDNPAGFCDYRKGDWWNMLELASNTNYRNLRKQVPLFDTETVIKRIKGQ